MAYAKGRSLEERIQSYGSPVKMLRSSMAGAWSFPLPTQASSWAEEQRAWAESVVLMDMGQHMPSVVYKGPDVKRLFSDLAVNSFEKFRKNNAKQFVFCRDDGFVIGDGVVVALEDDEYEVMAIPANTNWLNYQIETNNYDVSVANDPPVGMNPGERRFYRYQLQGPFATEVIEKAIGAPLPPIKFFHVGEFEIAGLKVRALSHTMTRKPGYELFGPRAEGAKILAALHAAGATYGMREVGAMAAPTSFEGGWVGLQMTAIYSGDYMKPFREWVSEYGFEGFASLGGSFVSDNIEDYYVTPYDLGYAHMVKFDHDFVGRAALEKLAAEPPKRQKVWLRWNNEDVLKTIGAALFNETDRARIIGVPYSVYSTFPNDQVLAGDQMVGISMINSYTVNTRGYFSLATIDAAYAVDGTEVEILWGDGDTSLRPIPIEPHGLTKLRATVSTGPLVS